MPTVLLINGYRVVINTHDHLPKHVHVYRGDGFAVIHIESGNIHRTSGLTERELRTARNLVQENAVFLAQEWDRIGPIP